MDFFVYVIGYYIATNVFAMVMYYADKKKAENQKEKLGKEPTKKKSKSKKIKHQDNKKTIRKNK